MVKGATDGCPTCTLPTLLPLPEAARKYGLDEAHLRSLVKSGKIKDAMVMDNVVVDEGEVAKTILRKKDLPGTRNMPT